MESMTGWLARPESVSQDVEIEVSEVDGEIRFGFRFYNAQ